jgi:LysM repeat protein
VVKSGDTLTGIAKANGIKNWKELYEANKEAIGDNPNLIKVGLKLKLPGGGAAGGGAAAAPGAAGPLTPEQRTQKQAELTKLDTEIQTARKGLMDIYATIQPGSTPEQRADGERRTAEAQGQLDQMIARQSALRTELGLPATGAAATDAASFGMPGGNGIPTATATSAA